jgi:hypothetical protein
MHWQSKVTRTLGPLVPRALDIEASPPFQGVSAQNIDVGRLQDVRITWSIVQTVKESAVSYTVSADSYRVPTEPNIPQIAARTASATAAAPAGA